MSASQVTNATHLLAAFQVLEKLSEKIVLGWLAKEIDGFQAILDDLKVLRRPKEPRPFFFLF